MPHHDQIYDGKWHHVVAVAEAIGWNIYVDGAGVTSPRRRGHRAPTTTSTSALDIGAANFQGFHCSSSTSRWTRSPSIRRDSRRDVASGTRSYQAAVAAGGRARRSRQPRGAHWRRDRGARSAPPARPERRNAGLSRAEADPARDRSRSERVYARPQRRNPGPAGHRRIGLSGDSEPLRRYCGPARHFGGPKRRDTYASRRRRLVAVVLGDAPRRVAATLSRLAATQVPTRRASDAVCRRR